jgi:hypothetical protein
MERTLEPNGMSIKKISSGISRSGRTGIGSAIRKSQTFFAWTRRERQNIGRTKLAPAPAIVLFGTTSIKTYSWNRQEF